MSCELCNHEHLTPLQCGTLHCNCVTQLNKPTIAYNESEENFRLRVRLNSGIDPYAPTTEFTKQKKTAICDRCKIDHPSNTLYDCPNCKDLRCCSQVYPHYEEGNDSIQYFCCSFCDNKVTVTHFEHGKIKT